MPNVGTFQAWQSQVISAFGFLTMFILCLREVAIMITGTISAIKEALKGLRGEK